MTSGLFSIFMKFAILEPFPMIFRLSQNHWTFPNAALVLFHPFFLIDGAKHSPPELFSDFGGGLRPVQPLKQ